MDYLKAIERRTATFEAAGSTYTTRTASLRMFFLLQRTLQDSPEDERILNYIVVAMSLSRDEVLMWDAGEAFDAYAAIASTNEPQPLHIDFARASSDERFEYEGRGLASIVTSIAVAFHWDRDFILDGLTYDEARCYLQEILLREHREKEYLYSLSDVGVSYDKGGKGRQKPFPPPAIPPRIFGNPWRQEERPEQPVRRVYSGIDGVVIRASQPER